MTQKIKANNLNNFVINNGKSLSHATHFVADLTGLNDNDDEIISAINMLKRVYMEMRIIILADSDKTRENKDLLRRIFEKGIFDIITNASDAELEKSLLIGKTEEECNEFFMARPDLTSENKRKDFETKTSEEEQKLLNERLEEEKQEQNRKREIILPNKEFRKYKPYISVAVCGTEHHVGATHSALQITKFLNGIGFKACYLEANDTQKIFYLKSMYPQNSNFNERKALLQCFGTPIYSGFNISNVMAENYDFYVFDLGVLNETKLTSFLTKDLRIVVSGSKAWELNALSESIKLVGTKNVVNFFLNFSVDGEESKLNDFMENLQANTYYPEYSPFPFKESNRQIFKKVFKEYILQEEREVVADKKKKGFFNKLF